MQRQEISSLPPGKLQGEYRTIRIVRNCTASRAGQRKFRTIQRTAEDGGVRLPGVIRPEIGNARAGRRFHRLLQLRRVAGASAQCFDTFENRTADRIERIEFGFIPDFLMVDFHWEKRPESRNLSCRRFRAAGKILLSGAAGNLTRFSGKIPAGRIDILPSVCHTIKKMKR